jgi:transposase-like protein
MGDALRKPRHGTRRRPGDIGYVDETYLKVQGQWCDLYQAINRDGNLVDTMLRATRDMAAAKSAKAAKLALKSKVTFCVQGVISPTLANLSPHYAFDM